MSELSVLKNIVRTGWVSSVNAAERTARVTFKDKGEKPVVSGNLKVLKNRHSYQQEDPATDGNGKRRKRRRGLCRHTVTPLS